MSFNTFHVERARVAVLSRHRSADDPVLLAARVVMRQESLVASFERVLRSAPPINAELRTRIDTLIDAHQAVATA